MNKTVSEEESGMSAKSPALTVVGGMLQNKFLTTLSENSDKIMKSTHEMVIKSIVNNHGGSPSTYRSTIA